jgi:4-amino-4-deoxy-L-arabinose transferase-like glycosyltransferase
MLARKHLLLPVAALILFVLYSYGSGRIPLLSPDEPRYAQVAKQMYQSGDYIIPKLGNFPWFEKPVLLYWLMSVSFALFGVNEFAARFPSSVAGVFTVFITGWITIRAADRQTGILASLILGSSLFMIGFSHAATFDMLLTACVTATFTFFLMHELQPSNTSALYAMYFCSGLAILAKGFVAIILIGLSIGGYLVLVRKISELRKLKLWSGILLIILVSGIWFIPVTSSYGLRFWNDFFVQHHLARYTTSQYHRSETVFFYLPVLLAGTFPWTAAPLLLFLKRIRSQTPQILFRFALCWLILTLLFFSFSRSKLPGYILPAAPAFAILGAIALRNFLKLETRPYRAFILTFAGTNGIIIISLFIGSIKFPYLKNPLLFMAGAIAFITLASSILIVRGRAVLAAAIYVLIPVAAILITVHQVYPAMNWSESKQLSAQISPALSEGKKLALYNIYDFSYLFYTNAQVETTPEGYFYPLTNYPQLYRYLFRKKEVLVLVGNEELYWIQGGDFWKVLHIYSGPEHSVVQLRLKR